MARILNAPTKTSSMSDAAALAAQLGIEQQKPQASFLQRILAPLAGIGSVPDVIYDAGRGKNPLTTYLGNIGQGVKTAFTGELPEEELKTTADLLKKAGLKGTDPLSNITRGVLGFAGDVALDPLTYVSFGAAGLTDDTIKATAKQAFGKSVTKKGVLDNALKLAKGGGDDVLKSVNKFAKTNKLTTEFQLFKNLLAKEAGSKMMKVGLPFLPKATIGGAGSSKGVQTAIKGAEAVVNPLGTALGLGWKGFKKVAPGAADKVTEGFYEMFNKTKLFESLGRGGLKERLDAYLGELRDATTLGPVEDKKIIDAIEGLRVLQKNSPEAVDLIPQIIEGTSTAPTKEIQKTVDLVKDALDFSQKKLVDMGLLEKVRPDYFPRDVLGYTPEMIQKKLKNDAPYILGDPAIARELKKQADKGVQQYVPMDMFRDILEKKQTYKVAEGLRPFEKQLGGHLERRTYDFMEEGLKEGVVYDPNIVGTFQDNFIRTKQAEATFSFMSDLKKFTDDTGARVVLNGIDVDKMFNGKVPLSLKEINIGMNDAVISAQKQAEKLLASQKRKVGKLLTSSAKEVKSITKELNYVKKELKRLYETQGFGGPMRTQKTNLLNALSNIPEGLENMSRPEQIKALQPILNTINSASDLNLGLAKFNEKLNKRITKLVEKRTVYQDLFTKYWDAASTAQKQLRTVQDLVKKNTFYADPITAKLLKNYTVDILNDEGLKDVIKIYDNLTSYFKKSVTSMGPLFVPYNIRNAVGDMTNMIIGGYRGRDNALEKGWKAAGIWGEIQKRGYNQVKADKAINYVIGEAQGKTYKLMDLFDLGRKSGLLSGSQVADELMYKAGKTSLSLGQKAEKALEKVTFVDLSRQREWSMRLANLWDKLKSKDITSVGEAVKLAKISSLDYSNLTNFEKQIMRRLMPFYSFTRQNLEFHLTNFAKQPGMYAGINKLVNAIGEASGGRLTEEERANLPDWMTTGLSIPISREGSNVSVLTSLGLPVSDIDATIGKDVPDTISNLITKANPMLRVPLEAASGYNFYFGEPIVSEQGRSGERYSEFPEWAKGLLGYREVERETKEGKKYTQKTVDPWAAYVLGNVPVISPTATIIKRLSDVNKSTVNGIGSDTLWSTLQLISGARVYSKNLTVAEQQELQRKERLIEEELYRRGYGNVYKKWYPLGEDKELISGLGQ